MENIMEKYAQGDASIPTDEPIRKGESRYICFMKKRERRALKRLAKMLAKHNKLMEQEAARRRAEEDAVAKAAAEKAAKHKNNCDEKGFLVSFGKAICKVLPQIVTAVVTGVLGFFFKRKSSRKILQAV